MGKIKNKILFLLLLLTFIWTAKSIMLQNFPDFNVYYSASKVYLQGGNPYLSNPQFFTSFTYPPLVLLFFTSFTLLPLSIAAKIWTLLSLVCFISSLSLLLKIFAIRFFSNRGIIFCILACCMFPVHFTLGMGQINLIVLFFTILSLYLLAKNRQTFSGLFLGLSIGIKLFPILLPFLLIIQKRWKAVSMIVATIVCLYTLAFFIVTPKINYYFFQYLFPTTLHSWKGDYYNQAMSGVIYRLTLNSELREFLRTFFTSLILLITITCVIIKRKYHFMVLTSVLITTNLLINSFSWQHHFVWTIIPLLTTYIVIRQNKLSTLFYIILFSCYICISINLKNPLHYPLLVQSHVFFGTFFLWCFIIYLLFKKYDYSTR